MPNYARPLPPVNRAKAKLLLTARLKYFAQRYNFTYNKIFIKNQRTRWGSCSSRNNINLNMNLINLPDKLMDYVILHELVHTQVKNHSVEFWQELDKLVGSGKQMQKKLRKYGVGLIGI